MMLRISNALVIYLLRLPLLLVVYTILLVIYMDGSGSFFLPMLLIFSAVCLIDTQTRHKRVFVVSGIALAVVLFLYSLPFLAIAVLCATLYRATAYSGVCFIWVAILCLLIVVAERIDASLQKVCLINALVSIIIAIITRQVKMLEWFLGSSYCRRVSKKTASNVIKRSYKFSVICMSVFLIIGLLSNPARIENMDYRLLYQYMSGPVAQEGEGGEEEIEYELIEPEPENADELPADDSLLVNIIYSIIMVISAVLILSVLYNLLKNMHKRATLCFEDFEEDEETDPAESGSRVGKRRKPGILGINNTVRRLFRRKVQEYINNGRLYPGKSDTPKKLAGVINEWEDVENLQRLYHKARYSGQTVKRTELDALYSGQAHGGNGEKIT